MNEYASASLVAKADQEPASASLVANRKPSHNVVSSSNSDMVLFYEPSKFCNDSRFELKMFAERSSIFIKEKLLLEHKLKDLAK